MSDPSGKYYETNFVTKRELAKFSAITKSQYEEIREYFEYLPDGSFSREDIEKRFGITTQAASGRLSDLQDAGEIEIVGQVVGRYGRPINLYRKINKNTQLTIF